MIQRYKSTPEDDRIVADETADVIDRATAITQLAFDQLYEFEPFFTKLLHHPSHYLRGEAIKALVGMWQLPRYLDNAVQILHTDPEWEARSDAAFALSMYTWRNGAERTRIVRELVRALQHDPDDGVQETCWRELVRLLAPDRKLSELSDDFDRERDVDWELLRPYLNNVPAG